MSEDTNVDTSSDTNFEDTSDFEGNEHVETTEDFEPSEEVIEHEPEVQKYTVKVDGQEVEVDLDELLKGYSANSAAQKKFQEAAQMRKQAETFIEMLRTNPTQVLTNPSLGLNFRELAEQYLVEQLQDEMLSPEEREFRDMKSRLQQFEEAEKAKADAEEQYKLQELIEARQADISKEIIGALEATGLPRNEVTISRMSHYMYQVVTNPNISQEVKDKVTFSDIADLVKQDWQAEIQSLLGTSNIETLLQLVGDEGVKKIRKWDVERVKQPKKQPTQHVTKSTKKKDDKNKVSMADFRSYLDTLR